MLDKASVQDVTSLVVATGNLTWTAPDDGGIWNVIVFRQTSANNTAGIGGSLNNTTASGTIYAADHLSKAGVEGDDRLLDAHVLTPATQGGDPRDRPRRPLRGLARARRQHEVDFVDDRRVEGAPRL